jgi:hypothetical protein
MDGPAKRQLFIEMASRPQGATAQDVHAAAVARGATDTVEAFHNLGRRLAHGGRLVVDESGQRKVYHAKDDRDGAWIDEDYLQSIVNAEQPMESLVVLREASRQLRTIPAEAWRAAAKVLTQVNAREAAVTAITAYAQNLSDHLEELARLIASRTDHDPAEEQRVKRRCEGLIEMLTAMCRDGLGLSRDAVHIPTTPEAGMIYLTQHGPSFSDLSILRDEIGRRVEDAPLIMTFDEPKPDLRLVVAGVDGSTQGGLLSVDGTAGDFAFGPPPQINLNTAAAVLNRKIRREDRETDVFLRLPSAPEDIQRRENLYTIMSPMFYPDLSPAEYMHSAWNAMDVLESRAARRALDSWQTPGSNVEVNPADVIIRDGTIVPNDRDPSHYAQPDTYGRIVREMVQLSWEMAQKSRDDAHTVAGAVKNSRVRVVGPILNYVIAQAAGVPPSTLTGWALDEMNAIADQQLLSRLLSHLERPKGCWARSAVFMRPFHATTPAFSRYYERDPAKAPARNIETRIDIAANTPVEKREGDQHGWAELRVPNPYTQMLDNVWFAGFYATPGVALGKGQALPRLELLVNAPTGEKNSFPVVVREHQQRLLTALATTGFTVSQDHDMFGGAGTIDFVPSMLQRAHETVTGFARDMKLRAGEYLDRLLAREIGARRRQSVRVRPWKPEELKAWRERLDSVNGSADGRSRRIA